MELGELLELGHLVVLGRCRGRRGRVDDLRLGRGLSLGLLGPPGSRIGFLMVPDGTGGPGNDRRGRGHPDEARASASLLMVCLLAIG